MNQFEEQQPTPPNPELPNHKQALLVVVITIFLTFGVGFLAMNGGMEQTQVFLVEVLTILPAIVYTKTQKFSFHRVFRLNCINRDVIICAILIGIGLTFASDEMDRLVQIFFPMPEVLLKAIEDSLKINTTTDFILIVFSAVVLAAVCEELLFRGFLQVSFENTFDVTRAVMLTALVFAIIHFNPWWTIQLIVFGIFLGVIAWKTNSVFPSMIIHFINNGTALIFTNLDESKTSWYLMGNHVNPLLLVLAIVMCVYGFRKLYAIYEVHHESDSPGSDYPDY
ncbi:CPBP family intramembrane metalloprotease [candidate division KSB1 bacterium]|nr:CPBP family intramembrane metalloprotease [candidate division KSB1 bacterium]